jgi:hypothetical protein
MLLVSSLILPEINFSLHPKQRPNNHQFFSYLRIKFTTISLLFSPSGVSLSKKKPAWPHQFWRNSLTRNTFIYFFGLIHTCTSYFSHFIGPVCWNDISHVLSDVWEFPLFDRWHWNLITMRRLSWLWRKAELIPSRRLPNIMFWTVTMMLPWFSVSPKQVRCTCNTRFSDGNNEAPFLETMWALGSLNHPKISLDSFPCLMVWRKLYLPWRSTW